MKKLLTTLMLGTSLALFVGCSGSGTTEDDGHAHEENGHSHEEEGGDGHDHAHDPASAIDLGANTVDGVSISVDQMGHVHSGDETLTFWVSVESQTDVSAVRVVVTTSDGSESLKVRAVLLDSGVWDADVTELPPDLAGGQAEVEVELVSGETRSASFGLSVEG